MWFVRRKTKEAIADAANALKVFNGHDSEANLKYRYGDKWWDEITRIERNLRALIEPR